MPAKGEYSDKYGFNVSRVRFDCGAQPLGRAAHGSLSVADIAGAQPTRYTAERKGVESVSVDESPPKSKFKGPSQPRNPLDPDYRLPPPPPPPVVSRPFIRDTLDVRDIDGSSKTSKKAPMKPNSSLNTADIEGSQPRTLAPRPEAAPRADHRLDVSDIAVKSKAPEPRKQDARGAEAALEDAVGRRRDAEWQKERNENVRRHGQEVVKARAATEELIRGVTAAGAAPHAAAAALEAELRALDRQGCGAVRAKDFETAVQRSGLNIPADKSKALSAALGTVEGSSMVPFHDVLARLYDHAGNSPGSAEAPPPPQWYLSRQRRVKTDVAMSLGQQPQATASAAAAVSTPQEREDRARPAAGKKIAGLERPAREDGAPQGSYWFADSRGGPESGAIRAGEGEKGDGGLWFASAGTDEAAVEEMGRWRPTKDAAIAVDLRKERNKGKVGSSGAGEGEAPPPKAPLLFSRPTPPTRQVRQMAEKDVELVRRLG